eukprot:CAMPEP_0182424100 /NCGR_PEP_ID=MMETSP1167-20130531/10251_1 /TAXON_ID=2988 /ORGANISM="Mallomonas Sp, Strain CCMP3275" /LENGTH=351 /DNA_ID=CAMNT_0024603645 /DNA_START=177 /DNA_END=1232 /DNA_ORIENTATION=-
MIDVDKNKIAQVLRNLVSNGLKFTSNRGKVDVNVSLETVNEPKGQVLKVEVSDNGAGISKVNQNKLFKEIVQFNPGILQGGGGSGLGLYISYGIAKLHEGELTVSSLGEGHGSVFTLILPISSIKHIIPSCPDSPQTVIQSEPVSNLRSSCHVISRKSSIAGRRSSSTIYVARESISRNSNEVRSLLMNEDPEEKSDRRRPLRGTLVHPCPPKQVRVLKVLVVDDTATSRKMQCRLLRTRYKLCEEAENGEDAVQKVMLAEEPFDLVLMDAHMPVMNGLKAAEKLRELQFKGIIIGVTGNVSADDIDEFMAHGANAVLPKPLNIHNLDIAVENLLPHSRPDSCNGHLRMEI